MPPVAGDGSRRGRGGLFGGRPAGGGRRRGGGGAGLGRRRRPRVDRLPLAGRGGPVAGVRAGRPDRGGRRRGRRYRGLGRGRLSGEGVMRRLKAGRGSVVRLTFGADGRSLLAFGWQIWDARFFLHEVRLEGRRRAGPAAELALSWAFDCGGGVAAHPRRGPGGDSVVLRTAGAEQILAPSFRAILTLAVAPDGSAVAASVRDPAGVDNPHLRMFVWE